MNLILKNIDMYILNFYVFTIIIELPLRYFLSLLNMGWLIYLRDAFLLISIFINLRQRMISINIIILGLGISFFSILGLLFTNNAIQVFFALKILLPFIFGFLIYPKYRDHINQLSKLYIGILLITCIGIAIDGIFDNLPWTNWEVDFVGVNVEGNTTGWDLWQNDETYRRLAGFTRLLIITAGLISYSSIWVFVYGKNKKKWALIGSVAILLTTCKISIFVYLVVLILLGIKKFFNDKLCSFAAKFVGICFVGLLILLPITSMFFYSIANILDTDLLILLFASFNDRLINGWPNNLQMISDYGSVVLGRGIGGIGNAVPLFDAFIKTYYPTDNMFIILYGICGVWAVIGLIYFTNKFVKVNFEKKINQFMIYLFIVIIGNGIMQDMMDQMTLIHLGLLVRFFLVKNLDRTELV